MRKLVFAAIVVSVGIIAALEISYQLRGGTSGLPATGSRDDSPISSDRIIRGAIGCRSQLWFNKIVTAIVAGDDHAAGTYISVGKSNKECRDFKIGEPVFIHERDSNGRICLRGQGDIVCLWTLVTAIVSAR